MDLLKLVFYLWIVLIGMLLEPIHYRVLLYKRKRRLKKQAEKKTNDLQKRH